jgi:hypothetical protein
MDTVTSFATARASSSRTPALTEPERQEFSRLLGALLKISGEDRSLAAAAAASPVALIHAAGTFQRDSDLSLTMSRNDRFEQALMRNGNDGLRMLRQLHDEAEKVEPIIQELKALVAAKMSPDLERKTRQTLFFEGPVLAQKHAQILLDDCKSHLAERERQRSSGIGPEERALLSALPAELFEAFAEAGVPFTVLDARTGREVTFAFRSVASNGGGHAAPTAAAHKTVKPDKKKSRNGKGGNGAHKTPEPAVAPAAVPPVPSLTPEQIRAQRIETLLTKQREAMEKGETFRLMEADKLGKRPQINLDIAYMPELLNLAREELKELAGQLPALKAQQEEYITAIRDCRANPYVMTAESILIKQALADEVPVLTVTVPAPVDLPPIKISDLNEFESFDDARIQELVTLVKAAREAARTQERSFFTINAQNNALKAAITVYENATSKTMRATDAAHAQIKQFEIDNGRLLAQLVQVNPTHPMVQEFMPAPVEQPQELTV